jgi:hypothetical protein
MVTLLIEAKFLTVIEFSIVYITTYNSTILSYDI